MKHAVLPLGLYDPHPPYRGVFSLCSQSSDRCKYLIGIIIPRRTLSANLSLLHYVQGRLRFRLLSVSSFPPPNGGVFLGVPRSCVMQVHSVLQKTMEGGRVSTWRFMEFPEGFCSIGGNYKLLQYRSKAAMEKSISWYVSKGYKPVGA